MGDPCPRKFYFDIETRDIDVDLAKPGGDESVYTIWIPEPGYYSVAGEPARHYAAGAEITINMGDKGRAIVRVGGTPMQGMSYLLHKPGKGYYRAGGLGYTYMKDKAGRFSFEEAQYAERMDDVHVLDEVSAPNVAPEMDGYALLEQRYEALTNATTPSAETKGAYIGEFSFVIQEMDEDGEERPRKVTVPWTTVKEIMAAIRTEAYGAA